ncbi:MAG: CCA tRNA nucleotidyltransferase [Desulfobulbaceae bacterium]|nr:MAG: CCA tRNA nucleotidyltransferase [Desulfobulbaceae bacterium]
MRIKKEYATIEYFTVGALSTSERYQVDVQIKTITDPGRIDWINELTAQYPSDLIEVLFDTAHRNDLKLYICGGVLRDWLNGTASRDLDLTIAYGAQSFLEEVAAALGRGTVVPLGMKHDDTCRLVVGPWSVDVSGFRKGAGTIAEDLLQRDFTINAMAAEAESFFSERAHRTIIDPLDGLYDLEEKVLKVCSGAFSDDPLRILRAFRFAAELNFVISEQTRSDLRRCANLVTLSAVERISYELNLIMASPRAHQAFIDMLQTGVLQWIIPELHEGHGVEQPPFHHLDVLKHNIETLGMVEKILDDPVRYFPESASYLTSYLEQEARQKQLKWAGLFHDVGKPQCRVPDNDDPDKITFYGHDETGAQLLKSYARRMRWSNEDTSATAHLITMHMHPFHLLTVKRSAGKISQRAKVNICRKAGESITGLFILARADDLSSMGETKPAGIDKELRSLHHELVTLYHDQVVPVINGPKLLTGNDLIDTLGLTPGPHFKEILASLERAVIEGSIKTRAEALDWVKTHMQSN